MRTEEVFYYDLRIGVDEDRKCWKERNIKMPAFNPVHALQLYQLFLHGKNDSNSYYFKNVKFAIEPLKARDINPILYRLKFSVRRIIEYKQTSTNGRTQPRYQRTKIFYISDQYKVRETDR